MRAFLRVYLYLCYILRREVCDVESVSEGLVDEGGRIQTRSQRSTRKPAPKYVFAVSGYGYKLVTNPALPVYNAFRLETKLYTTKKSVFL